MLLDSPPFLDASAYLSLPSCTLQHALVLALCVTYAPCLAPSLPLSICFSCPSRVRNRHPHARAHAHTRMRTRERTHTRTHAHAVAPTLPPAEWASSRGLLPRSSNHVPFGKGKLRSTCAYVHPIAVTSTCKHTHTHTYTPTRTHARSRARANTRTHTHTHTRNHTNMHTRTCKHAHLYVCLHAHDIDVVYGLESEQRFKASSVTRRQH